MRNITSNLLLSEWFSFYLFVLQSSLENIVAICTVKHIWSFPWTLAFQNSQTQFLQEFWTWLGSWRQLCDECGIGKRLWWHQLIPAHRHCSFRSLQYVRGTLGILEADHSLSPKECGMYRDFFGDQRGTVSRVSFGEDKVHIKINSYWSLATSQVLQFISSQESVYVLFTAY